MAKSYRRTVKANRGRSIASAIHLVGLMIALACGCGWAARAEDIVAFDIQSIPKQITAAKGTVLRFTGSVQTERPLSAVVLKVGPAVVVSTNSSVFALDWDTSRERLDFNRVVIAARTQDGLETRVASLSVELQPKTKYNLKVANPTKILHGVVPISLTSPISDKSGTITYFLDGKSLGSSTATDGAYAWDTWFLTPGRHEIRAVVKEGICSTVTPIVECVIQPTISIGQLGPTGTKITVDELAKVAISATFAVASDIKSVRYRVDDEIVSELKAAPFETGTWQITQSVADGKHRLSVGVTDAEGRQAWSPEAEINLTIRRQAKQEASKGTPIEITARFPSTPQRRSEDNELPSRRRNWNFAALRQQAAAVGQYTGKRNGALGRVTGLSVLVLGGVYEIGGGLLPITATFTVGSGKPPQLLADADEGMRVSLQTAFVCTKNLLAQKGLPVEWTKYDMFVECGDTTKVAGGSAGIAFCTALYSVIVAKPVDTSVAMSGVIGLGGEVKPVGGVGFKAERALSTNGIQTIVFPASLYSIPDLVALWQERPEIVAGKRIILAENLHQVLRQAVIGYDENTLTTAERYFVEALHAFGDKHDDVALSNLRAAMRLTPENASMEMWYAIMQDARGR